MSRTKNKQKRQGHYCWCCGRRRPNEKFSGKGHARHLCRECSKLGKEELTYRQNRRDLDRCITLEGIIPRKQHTTFETFLNHEDARIRTIAQEMRAEDVASRAWLLEEQQMVEEEASRGETLAEIRQRCEDQMQEGKQLTLTFPLPDVEQIPF